MQVLNIPFYQYSSLKDRAQFDYYLRYGKIDAADVFKLGDFTDLSFGFVKDMQELLNFEGLTWLSYFEMMGKHTGLTVDKIAKYGLFTLQQGRIYCRQQIEMINKLESQNLSSGVGADEEQAGIDRFQMFRAFPQFDKLIKEWGMTWEQVEQMPYSRAFAKLKYDKEVAEYTEQLTKIRTKR